jgi:hypothetical protein
MPGLEPQGIILTVNSAVYYYQRSLDASDSFLLADDAELVKAAARLAETLP